MDESSYLGQFEVVRYKDGTWTSYNGTNSPLPFESPSSNRFSYDLNNDLWMVCNSGLFKFENEMWVNKTSLLSDEHLKNLIDIVHTQNGNTYILQRYFNIADENLLYELDPNENVRTISIPINSEKPYSKFLQLDNEKNTFFLGFTNQGCYHFSDDLWTKVKTSETILSSNTTTLSQDINGQMYLTTGEQFSYYDRRVFQYANEDWVDYTDEIPYNGMGYRVFLIHSGPNGEVYMSANNSLYIQNGTQWDPVILPEISSEIDEENSRIHFDKNGDRWLFNLSQGSVFYEMGQTWNEYIQADHGSGNFRNCSIINHPTRNEMIISGYKRFSIFNLDTKEWSRIEYSDLGFPNNNYNKLIIHTDGETYGFNNELFFKLTADYNVEVIAEKDSIFISGYEKRWSEIQSIDGDLWLGMSGAIAKYDLNDFEIFDRTNSGIANGYINNIHRDNNNNIWCSSSHGGLSIFNPLGITDDLLDKGGLTASKNQRLDFEINIYPNPNSGIFSIDTKDALENFNVIIYDVLGRRIMDYRQVTNNQKIEIQSVQTAYYFIQIIDPATRSSMTKKIVVTL